MGMIAWNFPSESAFKSCRLTRTLGMSEESVARSVIRTGADGGAAPVTRTASAPLSGVTLSTIVP